MKSLHSGEGSNYIDQYGDSRQYTTVDWTAKTTIGFDAQTLEEAKLAHEQDKKNLIEKILKKHPTLLKNETARAALVLRGELGFRWNTESVKLLVQDDIMKGWDLFKSLCLEDGTWDSMP